MPLGQALTQQEKDDIDTDLAALTDDEWYRARPGMLIGVETQWPVGHPYRADVEACVTGEEQNRPRGT